MSAKLSVHLVTWNGSKYVPYLFDSLRRQTWLDWELLVIDNNSKDDTVVAIQKELLNFPVASRVIINKNNNGFAKGHNQAFNETDTELFLMLNQDMYLAPDCLKNLASHLINNPGVSAVSPRLMRWDFIKTNEGLDKTFSDNIDALGLKIFRNRRVIEQYTKASWGKIKNNFKNPVLPVFGLSGALPMYKRQAIESVLFPNGTFLDEQYFMYKEDVDLCYRLAAAGHYSNVLLEVVAYHDRTGAGPVMLNDWSAHQNKKNHNQTVKYYSYRNHLITLYKNEYKENFRLDFFFILWYELKKFCYFLLVDYKVLKGLKEIWAMRSELKTKRKFITGTRRVSWNSLRKWLK